MTVPPLAQGCALCPGTSAVVESDRNKFEREVLANHIVPGQGHRYRSKGAYQRMLKQRRMTDDVTTKELIARTRDTGFRERVRDEKIRRYLQGMTPMFAEKSARLCRR